MNNIADDLSNAYSDGLRDGAPKWISVEEKTPETRDWVLVAPMLVPEGWYGVPAVCEYCNGVWFDRVQEGPFEEWTGTKITHWMPLPDEPGMVGK